MAGSLTAGCGRPPAPPPPLLDSSIARSYAAASAAAQALIGADAADAAIEPQAIPLLLTHGRRTPQSVVLFHGFTNCPKQFAEFAQRLFARGINVFVPRLPKHGYRDRLTRALADLTVAELQACAQNAATIGAGLGDRVTALGLSLGGTMVCWLAQTQPIDLAIPLAPFLAPSGYSESAAVNVARLLSALPSMYWWWDPRIRDKSLPLYAYPGYPTHALAEVIFLGDATFALAKNGPPRAKRCDVVLNTTDPAINDDAVRALLALWRAHGGSTYRDIEWTDILPVRHDVIDPTTFPQARTLIYPRLEALIAG
ncbi:MAG: alpha/beta fold hydrolase [Candidatus Eremiobacteraeota bacterium]|nr:alpha/beta fold hydrolase [Candidatus Eremiobacteraeota bacterium]